MNSLVPGDAYAPVQRPRPLVRLREDISAVRERDPAARSPLEIALAYPGLHAVWIYRMSHRLWVRHSRILARVLSQIGRALTGIEIHPGAKIGRRLFIDHGMGVVIGETSTVGDDVTLYHGVTLGGTSLRHGKRHPDLGDRVTVGAGAKILGAIHVGEDSRIGANAVVVRNVPRNSVVVGIPGQIIKKAHPHHRGDSPDLDHALLPDVIGKSIRELFSRVEQIEKNTASGNAAALSPNPRHFLKDGRWIDEDFSI